MIEERLLRYTSINTQSNEQSDTIPTNLNELVLANLLVKECKDIGVDEVFVDDSGNVYGYLKSNTVKMIPAVGFIAHMDTAPAYTSENVKPRIIRNYDGKDIKLNDSITTRVSDFKKLKEFIGKDLIVTDGNTLLGGDDKAGIAEIMEMLNYFVMNPTVKHGPIYFSFSCDEETGNGIRNFNINSFPVKFSYTIDGEEPNCLSYENFNAGKYIVKISGISSHLGEAKGKLVNSILIGMQIIELLPKEEFPEKSEDYQGFYHIKEFKGDSTKCTIEILIRDFNKEAFEGKKELLCNIFKQINKTIGYEAIEYRYKESYKNMREYLEGNERTVELAKKAILKCGLDYKVKAIRGGTDGAQLTSRGLFTPNLGTGSYYVHSSHEFCVVNEMKKCVEILIELVKFIEIESRE